MAYITLSSGQSQSGAEDRSGENLVKCLHDAATQTVEQPTVDAIIMGGAVIVQMLKPRMAQSFEKHFNTVFAPHILRQLDAVNRIDLVWDVYREDTLKRSAQEKRGSGQRRKVLPKTQILSDWKGFLRVDDNKDELFKLLANMVIITVIMVIYLNTGIHVMHK